MKPFLTISIFVLTHLLGLSVALAQSSAASQETSIPGGTLAIIAYGVLWALIFGFIFITMRRQRALDRDLGELEQRMDEVFDDLESGS